MSIQNDMSIDEAIKKLDEVRNFWIVPRHGEGDNYLVARKAIDMAIDALREKHEGEKNEPFTKEELQEELDNRRNGWLWCVDLSDENHTGWYWNANLYRFSNLAAYGKTWLAYRKPPKEDAAVGSNCPQRMLV